MACQRGCNFYPPQFSLVINSKMAATAQRGEVATSRCHGGKISGSQKNNGAPGLCKYDKKDEKIDIKYDFLVHNCSQGQSGSPYFSSIVRQCKWSSLSRKIVEIKKTCYHGNLTS